MKNNLLLLCPIRFVAQLVEQLTLNQRVEGSSPSKPTKGIAFLSDAFFISIPGNICALKYKILSRYFRLEQDSTGFFC